MKKKILIILCSILLLFILFLILFRKPTYGAVITNYEINDNVITLEIGNANSMGYIGFYNIKDIEGGKLITFSSSILQIFNIKVNPLSVIKIELDSNDEFIYIQRGIGPEIQLQKINEIWINPEKLMEPYKC